MPSSPVPTLAKGVAKRIAREVGFNMDAPELVKIRTSISSTSQALNRRAPAFTASSIKSIAI
jgi:hypothetical protein